MFSRYLNNGSVVKTKKVAIEFPEAIQVQGVDGNVGGDLVGVATGTLPVLRELGGGGGGGGGGGRGKT